MPSMDDVYERMTDFARALEQFQESLEASLHEMQLKHEIVDPLWQDERRRQYEQHFQPLKEMLDRYCRIQYPEYAEFLTQKLRAMHMYLYE